MLETIADHDMPSERRVALETDEVFSTPIYAPDSARTWGADKIFFTTAPSEQAPTRKRKALAAKRPD